MPDSHLGTFSCRIHLHQRNSQNITNYATQLLPFRQMNMPEFHTQLVQSLRHFWDTP